MTLAAYKRRKERQDYSAFAALVDEPATAEFALPANGRFRVVATLGSIEDELACTLTGPYIDENRDPVQRLIQTPELAVNGYVQLDRLERGVTVTLEPGFELWVDAGLGRYVKVAELV
jgi:hypothetical protein